MFKNADMFVWNSCLKMQICLQVNIFVYNYTCMVDIITVASIFKTETNLKCRNAFSSLASYFCVALVMYISIIYSTLVVSLISKQFLLIFVAELETCYRILAEFSCFGFRNIVGIFQGVWNTMEEGAASPYDYTY